MTQQTFLVEIGTEELPPKDLRALSESFASNFTSELANANLKHGVVSWFATPRRLALKVINLSTVQPDHIIKKYGPAVSQAFDSQGNPSRAAEGWARSCNISLDQAKRFVTNKGEYLLYYSNIKGQPVQKLLLDMVNIALSKLSTPKLMRWSDSAVQFVRPVHTVTLLLASELIAGVVLGVESARTVRGHRFMGEAEFILQDANDYPKILLERGKVIADYEARKALIKRNLEREAKKIGGTVNLSEPLLEEVVSLVEWPVVLVAKFEKKFLAVPAEALVHTMQNNQKCFPVYGEKGQLLPNFMFVANIESKDLQQIIVGNEKVVRSRLADAEFFFNTDCKQHLEDWLPRLETVLFQKQLGTLRDKTNRIQSLSSWIASKIGANIKHAARAGLLSKCDLMTNMVFEFTEIQGIMGMHYARRDGEIDNVAIALSEQYQPRLAYDSLPQSRVSCALAIAEKIDTLVGIFGIGKHPKSDKDPFALRRAALGVLRIIVEKNLPLDLHALIEEAIYLYDSKLTNVKTVDKVVEFMLGRFRAWYQEKGYEVDVIQSVLACRPTKLADVNARIKAISHFRTLKEATSLVAANKRISNILSQSREILNDNINLSVLQKSEEIQLVNHLTLLSNKLESYFAASNYQDVFIELTTLCEPIDIFFKNVIVMDENKTVRINRLTLLNKLRILFLRVADLSILQ
ncbi:glycine--tRNA ligase subunit beta [Candidatus Gillettellia adelgis]